MRGAGAVNLKLCVPNPVPNKAAILKLRHSAIFCRLSQRRRYFPALPWEGGRGAGAVDLKLCVPNPVPNKAAILKLRHSYAHLLLGRG